MLNGQSNFNLELIHGKDGYKIIKSADSLKYATRLKLQKEKQEKFKGYIEGSELRYIFEVPSIIDYKQTDSSYSFTMPFYNGYNLIDVFESGDIIILERVLENIKDFLIWEFKNSVIESGVDLVVRKIESLEQNFNNPLLKRICSDLIVICKDKLIGGFYVGVCHGDLTFSNMIFTQKVILLDFLDSFIETPYQDIAKIYQEINLFWSYLMQNRKSSLTKIKIGYNFIREHFHFKILEIAKIFPHVNLEHINIFYLITLLRILPYTKTDISDLVFNEVDKVYKQIKGDI